MSEPSKSVHSILTIPTLNMHLASDSKNAGIGTDKANLGGVDMSLIIDSGASCNVVDRHSWEE